MRKVSTILVSLACLVALAVPATAGSGDRGNSNQFPAEIALPDGFFPEGIAVGRGSTFYVGSLSAGAIFKGDLRTGEGEVFTNPVGLFSTLGLSVDTRNRVWVAGGITGAGRVYDGSTGDLLAVYTFTAPVESLINDVIVTNEAAWFTDSGTANCAAPPPACFPGLPRLFKVVFEPGQVLPDPSDVSAVEQIVVEQVPDIDFSNLNGIETMPGDSELILVHNSAGALYRFDPETGETAVIYGPDNGDDALVGADGMSRLGTTLFVVENGASRIAVIQLDPSTGIGTHVGVLDVDGADTPTTSAVFGSAIYTVDARFSTLFQGPYKVFRVER